MQKFLGILGRLSVFYFSLVFVSCGNDSSQPQPSTRQTDVVSLDELMNEGQQSYSDIVVPSDIEGSSAFTENFCDQLYDKQHKGNADLVVGHNKILLRFGLNKNDFSYSSLAFQRARWLARNKLPGDLKELLNAQHFFDIVEKFQRTPPESEMSQIEMEQTSLWNAEIKAIWTWAIDRAVERRVAALRSASSSSESSAQKILSHKVEKAFTADLYKTIWEESPLWWRAVSSFYLMQKNFIETIEQDFAISPELKIQWKSIIGSIQIFPPGADATINDSDCATSKSNAFYYPSIHKFTVCGGLLGSGNIVEGVIAHELAHSLGADRLMLENIRESEFSTKIKKLRDQVCTQGGEKKCPDIWSDFRSTAKSLLEKVNSSLVIPHEKILACLQPHAKDLAMTGPDLKIIKGLAKARVKRVVSTFADEEKIVQIVTPEKISSDGTEKENPLYLNPCADPDWDESIYETGDSDGDFLLFLSASYMCGDETAEPDERLNAATQEAMDLYGEIVEKLIPYGGPFSTDSDMLAGSYSDNPHERFADYMGYRVFAHRLRPLSLVERRQHYLAAMSWFCNEPSLEKKYPKKSLVQKSYSLEPHSMGLNRRQEIQVGALREILGLKKDFELKECEL